MKEYQLFIDESGICDPKNKQSDLYILCGCCFLKGKKDDVDRYADQIKFKYWGNTNVVFHSCEIGRESGHFSIFKNKPDLKNEFLKDLLTFLKKSQFILFAIVVDKILARKRGWNYFKVVEETAKNLIINFLAFLFSQSFVNGKIVIESATAEKDKYYLQAFSYFLSPGFVELGVDYKETRKRLTSLSFVTKNNHDIEEQIVDLLSYAAKCKYEKDVNKKNFQKNSYEDKIINIINNKLFTTPTKAKARKMKFYKSIEPFCIIPK